MRKQLLSAISLCALLATAAHGAGGTRHAARVTPPAARPLVVQDEKAQKSVPKKGDTVVAVGCARGGTLESQETRLAEEDTVSVDWPIIYRLTGDKELLKQLKSDHSKHLEEITGVLKSRLPDDKGRGRPIGNTRIFIGVGPGNASQQQALPVLEVKSVKHVAPNCGK